MLWTDCRIVAFDTETTGLTSYAGDRVMEFGAVEIYLDAQLNIARIAHHQYLIDPQRPIPREASQVTGITEADVRGKPAFSAIARELHSLLNNSIVVAHNFGFDLGFMKSEFARCGLSWPNTVAEVDTLVLARMYMTHMRRFNLSEVSSDLRVELINAHRAVDDAEACGRAFVAMAKRYSAPQDFIEFVRWSVATAPPPKNGHISIKEQGAPEFTSGPHQGQLVEYHTDYLQWMSFAREHVEGCWSYRYEESLRSWILSWLRARTYGTFGHPFKGGSAQSWQIDPKPWREDQQLQTSDPRSGIFSSQ